jgi:exo-1,4-beta-D-glucosaminidase
MEPNAGYYFMQNACEPAHVQFNQDDSTVMVVNRSYSALQKVTVEADGYDLQSKRIIHQSESLQVNAAGVHSVFTLADKIKKIKGVTFLLLTMKDASGKTLSNNSYWLASKQNFTSMASMPKTQVDLKTVETGADKSNRKWTFRLSNPTNRVAFFVRLQLMNHGEEILPTFWSANYITLAPHETRTITVNVPLSALKGNNVSVQIEGWNLNTEEKAQLTF